MDKIRKLLAKLTKRENKKTQIHKIRGEKGDITTAKTQHLGNHHDLLRQTFH